MKVRDLLKKYRTCATAPVRLTVVPTGSSALLRKEDIRELPKEMEILNFTVQSFDVIDNVMTIYAKQKDGVR